MPAPNSGFVAIAAGGDRSLAIRGYVGDVDGDGHVDVADLLSAVYTFGLSQGDPGYDPECDFNNDNAVDNLDLLILVENFGK